MLFCHHWTETQGGGVEGEIDGGGGPLHFFYHGGHDGRIWPLEQASKRSVEDLKWCSNDLVLYKHMETLQKHHGHRKTNAFRNKTVHWNAIFLF